MRHVQVNNLHAPKPAGRRQGHRAHRTASSRHAVKVACHDACAKFSSRRSPALPSQAANDNLWALDQTVLRLPYMPQANSRTGNLKAVRKAQQKPCRPQSGTHASTQVEVRNTACIAHRYQLGLLYSATLGEREGRPRGAGGTKKQERPRTPTCQRCTGHIGAQAFAAPWQAPWQAECSRACDTLSRVQTLVVPDK